MMLAQGTGLIINVSSHGAMRAKSAGSKSIVPYSVVKAALHRLTADMAAELRESGIAVVSIWPPATKTEGVLANQEVWSDLSDWNSPLFTGRTVAALVAGEDLMARSGEALVIEDVAQKLGITDDG
jgi:NAD(P)-dependent dehydrogenase (short-subunit alcohol dehydrogenase family)